MANSILSSDNEVLRQDPLLRLLCVRLGWSNGRIILAASVFAAFVLFIIGGMARRTYEATGAVTSTHAGRELFLIAMWALIFSPIIWWVYLWQARTISQVFIQLSAKGVFGAPDSEGWLAASRKVKEVVRRSTHPLISLLAFLSVLGLWTIRAYSMGKDAYWFEVRWYFPMHVIAWSLAIYILYVAVIRQVVFIADLSVLFRNTVIHVNPLEPDGVGGLGAVGALISWTIVFLIALGLLISIFIGTTYKFGDNIFARPDTLSAFAFYVVLAPFVLIVPTVAVRNAMLKARSVLLAPIAEEFRRALEQTMDGGQVNEKELGGQNERLKALQERHKIIMDTYPILPISENVLKIFSLAASIPYLSGIVPVVIDWLKPG